MSYHWYSFTVFILVLSLTGVSRADLNSAYGFGSTTAALVGSNRGIAYDAFVLERSPSLMSHMPDSSSYGFIGAKDFFEKINDVQVDSYYLGGSATTGSFDTDVTDTAHIVVGGIWALGADQGGENRRERATTEHRNYRVGLTASSPIERVSEINTKDPYTPTYGSYWGDTQRLTLALGFSGKATKNLSLGLGLHYYLIEGASYQAKMPTDSDRTSTSNAKVDVKPTISTSLGATWSAGDHNVTAYFSGTRDHKIKFRSDVRTNIIGNTRITIDSEASLYYDPETWSLAYAYGSDTVDFHLGFDLEKWSRYDGGFMRTQYNSLFRQYPVEMNFKDIFIVKSGFAFRLASQSLKFGIGYRPSPHNDLSGETNYIDPDRWILGLGHGFTTKIWNLFRESVVIDNHIQCHYLVPQNVVKTNSTHIGSPGYRVGGYVLSYGITLTVGI